MSGPSSFKVALDFCAASRRACRSALPIAGNSRSMMNFRTVAALQLWRCIATRVPPPRQVLHDALSDQPHRGECRRQRNDVEIDLQRSVLVFAERLLGAADLVDDLTGRADPRGARDDLVRSARLAELFDYFFVTGIILWSAAIEPVGGGLDQ